MQCGGAAKPGINQSDTNRKKGESSGSESGGNPADSGDTSSNSTDRPPDQLYQADSSNLEFGQQSSTQEQLTMDQHGDKTGSDEEDDIVIEDEDDDNNDKGEKSKEVIILSPTNFDSANMPRSEAWVSVMTRLPY